MDDDNSPVTGITQVINYSGLTLQLVDLQNSSNNITVQPNDNAESLNIWVGWATDADEFPSHHLVVTMGSAPAISFYIWQQGSRVRYSTDNTWLFKGTAVPGDSEVGKSKTMSVDNNLNLRFKNA